MSSDPTELEFWKERWRTKQTAFHEGAPNVHLQKYWGQLGIPPQSRVLVPLCGASVDLIWLLQRGYSVVGIELSRDAIEQFFASQEITAMRELLHRTARWSAGNLTIFEGNLFDVADEDIGTANAVYDRAALIALSETARPRYISKVKSWLSPGSPGLLVSMTYDTTKRGGPPFRVSDAEVCQHWPGATKLTQHMLDEERWKPFDAVEAVWQVSAP